MKSKQELLEQFDADCKLQGGSTESIHKAYYKAMIEIECDKRGWIRATHDLIEIILNDRKPINVGEAPVVTPAA